mmetsp:Transcript_16281/g.42999  ORF Transcript_16281/g.42999 Transcript_16281/m.42999 type:complete len:87 (-) Transcript_16281:144-404(-)
MAGGPSVEAAVVAQDADAAGGAAPLRPASAHASSLAASALAPHAPPLSPRQADAMPEAVAPPVEALPPAPAANGEHGEPPILEAEG